MARSVDRVGVGLVPLRRRHGHAEPLLRSDASLRHLEPRFVTTAVVKAVPVTVIGGFLGTGKTTLLNHLIAEASGQRRLGVLVNDFGAINLDADLVVGVEGDMVSLGGGCICCSIREDLSSSIFAMMRRDEPPEHLLIEASGVSDPGAVARALAGPPMSDVVTLDAVVVVVDAEARAGATFRQRIVEGGQLKAADIIVINKTDLVDAETLAGVVAKLRKSYPRARQVEAEHGRVSQTLALGIGGDSDALQAPAVSVKLRPSTSTQDVEVADHEREFSTWSYETEVPLSARRLKKFVDGLPASVFRVKGIVQVREDLARSAILHVAGKRAALELDAPWAGADPGTRMVFIGAPGSIEPEKLRAGLAACESPAESAGSGFGRWVRGLFG